MREIREDAFYEVIKPFDPDGREHAVGEVVYYLLCDDRPYCGQESHREALRFVFDILEEERSEDRDRARELFGDDLADRMTLPAYDIGKAKAAPLTAREFFYCPNIIKIGYYGNVWYDAEWKPDDENFGTTVPYWYALMEPVHGRRNRPEDFRKVNEALFPNGTDSLDIFEWTTDWSDYFDDGHEWYGSCCWSVYDRSMDRYVVMLVSATD